MIYVKIERKGSGNWKRAAAWLLAAVMIFTTPAIVEAFDDPDALRQEDPVQDPSDVRSGVETGSGLFQSVVCLGEEKMTGQQEKEARQQTRQQLRQTKALRAPKYAASPDSSFDTYSVRVGSIMNQQMRNYLSDIKTGQMAEVTTYRKIDGANASVTFDFKKNYYKQYPIPNSNMDAGNRVMRWVNAAIADYPNLCTLNSSIAYSYTVDNDNNRYLASLVVYSPLEAGDIKTVTNQYQTEMATLIKVPQTAWSMTVGERVLYIHDKIVTMADYGTGNSAQEYIPAGVLLNHKGVCQSYAYVMNQALVALGIDSLFLISDTHAWNAVKANGKWYYVDATWDDPLGDVPISFVSHKYLLSAPSVFADQHTMTDEYLNCYSTILKNTGTDYDNYFPKQTDSNGRSYNRAFDYLNGTWYFSDRLNIYTWNGTGSTSTQFTDIATGDPEVCTAVYGGELYYSTPNGIFRYNKNTSDTGYVSGNVTAFVFRGADMDYQIDGQPPISASTPTPAADTPAPTATVWQEPSLSSAKPGSTATTAPTASATAKASASPTASVSASQSPAPSASATAKASASPTASVSASQSPAPSASATAGTTAVPSASVAPTAGTSREPGTTILPLITKAPGETEQPTTAATATPSKTAEQVTPVPVIRPAKGAVKKLSNCASRKIRIIVKKIKNAGGYQIWYSTGKKFKKNVKKKYTTSLKNVVGGLKKKTYYVKVRAFVKDTAGKRLYGPFSSVKKIRVRK